MSKGLETLKCGGINVYTKDYGKCVAYTQDCIDIIEKELKALEIIIKKNVDIEGIKEALGSAIFLQLETYNSWVCYDKEKMLTEKEFELLKEVLCNDK